MNKGTAEYEKDLNELREQILKEGDTLVSKRALLERFCEIDKEYNGEPWNLLQILANINVLIGEEPCEDAISKASVFEIMGNLMDIPYDFDRQITEKDVSKSMDKIRDLPSVTPKTKWISTNEKLPNKHQWVLVATEDWQKTIEVMCYQGIQIGRRDIGNGWEEYEYPLWTSGHGDIQGYHPKAWMPLPKSYIEE